jgi:monofunctional biosynthetic peptidoglycan transglycosylase
MGRRRRKPRLLARVVLGAGKLVGAVVVFTAVLVVPWRWIPPPTSAFMLRERFEGRRVVQHWMPLRTISPQLGIAVVAAEDQRFPQHAGFDFEAIERAMGEKRRNTRGASTITQQVAKNLYLWPGRSFVRKGLEAWLTIFIEGTWPKRRILEVYLNVAEFGPGVFGADAASALYFRKPPRALNLWEASLLAAALPSPKRSSVTNPSPYLRGRAAEIEAAARRLGGSGYLARL